METPVNHWEHSELEKLMNAKFDALQAEDRRLNERLKIVEQQNQQIMELSVTIQKQADNISDLAKNIESICNLQKAEGERLQQLEDNRVSDDAILKNLEELNGWRKDIELQDGKKWRSFIKQSVSFGIGILSALSIAYIRAKFGF